MREEIVARNGHPRRQRRATERVGFGACSSRSGARLAYAAYLGLLQMAREAPDRRLDEPDLARFMIEVNSVLIEGS